ncbi:MAG: hypothetical protein ABH880_02210 [Patescibacteria group bacterium]
MKASRKEVLEICQEQLAALFVVIDRLEKSVDFLERCLSGRISFLLDRDTVTTRMVTTHYIVNNLYALFDDGKKEANSLPRIARRFEKHFPRNFFSEYLDSVQKLSRTYADDIERLEKNRHLSTAHIYASEKEQLGWDPVTAERINKTFGGRTHVAKKKSLHFITPNNVLDMSIIGAIPEIKNTLSKLQLMIMDNEYNLGIAAIL